MGYNKSKRSVTKSILELDQLEQAHSTIRFPTSNPIQLQRRLLEALAAAEVHEEFKHYHVNIKPFFRFEVDEGYLIAKFVMLLEVGKAEIHLEDENGDGSKQKDAKELVRNHYDRDITIDNAYSLIDVLGSLLGNLDATEITFPNVVLDEKDKLKLWAWTKESEHTEWLFIDMMEKGIVLTRKDGIPLEMLWSPEREENEFEQ